MEFDCEPTVWPQGVFKPSKVAFADLYAFSQRVDFAVFVFTPDDVATIRGEVAAVARDNVIFELGLFCGSLGPSRCFFVVPHDMPLHLPTDLIGMTPLCYMAKRNDGNLRAALGPACNKVRRAMREESPRPPPTSLPGAAPLSASDRALEMIEEWNGPALYEARSMLRGGIPMTFAEDDETGLATDAVASVYSFLNSMADGVLSGMVDETLARREFQQPALQVWKTAYTYFTPPGEDAADAWRPLPPLALIVERWSED